MSLEITGFDLGATTFSVSANMLVGWQNVRLGDIDYELNTNYPYASGDKFSTTCSSVSVEWGTAIECTSSICVTSITDTDVVLLCAYDTAEPTTYSIYVFNPYYLVYNQTRLSDTTLSATAFYKQVSTNNLMPVGDDVILEWSTEPATSGLYIISPTETNFMQHVTGTALLSGCLYLSSNRSDFNTYQLQLSSPDAISVYSNIIKVNSPFYLNVLEVSTTYIIISAEQYDLPLTPDKNVLWSITPYTSSEYISGNGTSSLNFDVEYTALSAGSVILSTTNLTAEYTYTLSSYMGVVSGQFRPYLDLSVNDVLIASYTTIDDAVLQHQYLFDVHGYYNNIPHNLPKYDYLVWKNTSNNTGVVAVDKNGTGYTLDSINTVNNIDNLNVSIVPYTTTTYPKLCTYSFLVSALTGSNILTDAIKYTTLDIVTQEWLSDTIFKPDFTIQYEPSGINTIYRELTGSTYVIKSNTILPASTLGNVVYTFNDGSETVYYNTITGGSIPDVYHYFDGSTPCLCTINMTVQTSGIDYPNYSTKRATPKTIVFADFPVASGFIVYPEFQWDGTSWLKNVDTNGEILLSSATLSSYSFCHTENFFVSSNETKATQYVWSIQNSLNDTVQTITTLVSPTGWIAVKSPSGTTMHSICAALFTSSLPVTMPAYYYDVPEGRKYSNFSTTFDTPTSTNRKHIDFYGLDQFGISPVVTDVQSNPTGTPSNLYLSGSYRYNGDVQNITPFDYQIGAYSFLLSSNYYQTQELASVAVSNVATKVYLNVDDIGNSYLSLPKFENNSIAIIPQMSITPKFRVPHPSAVESTWCFTNNTISSFNSNNTVFTYPVAPFVYTPNKYVTTGVNVVFENLAQCFSGVKDFTWTDGTNSIVKTDCTPYVTAFDTAGIYDVTLTTNFSGLDGDHTLTNIFANIVNVDNNYQTCDSLINRVYQDTILELPYDKHDCSIGLNDWLISDTVNALITKLYNNLEYLKNMSELYDVPPTEYYGWLGTMNYSNSSKHFRWFVNIPNINYGYNEPNKAVSDTFTNLKDLCVKDNLMFISNGTTVSILSSDFKANEITKISYKAIDDPFVCIRAVKLDNTDRIYLLDSFDDTNTTLGSKNRILVYQFNRETGSTKYLYSWGGLGGPKSKNGFVNPNDIYIDSENRVWVSDTGNKVIKVYSKTGSWLFTITCDEFNETPPLGVVVASDSNVYVLTTNKVIKFDSNGNKLSVNTLKDTGAKYMRACSDDGFFYISYSNKIVKYMYVNGTESVFAYNDFYDYTLNYGGIFHDEFRNLYITNGNHILKYIDKLYLITLKQDTEGLDWSLDDLKVDENEYIQDWVLNRCFQRLYDNIEIIRKSILGKFVYKTIQNVTTISTLSSIEIPSDFDYCNYDFLYDQGKYVTTDIITEVYQPAVRSFTTSEYKTLPYTKDQIYIGLNELVTASVINRPLQKLFECEETLLEMIS